MPYQGLERQGAYQNTSNKSTAATNSIAVTGYKGIRKNFIEAPVGRQVNNLSIKLNSNIKEEQDKNNMFALKKIKGSNLRHVLMMQLMGSPLIQAMNKHNSKKISVKLGNNRDHEESKSFIRNKLKVKEDNNILKIRKRQELNVMSHTKGKLYKTFYGKVLPEECKIKKSRNRDKLKCITSINDNTKEIIGIKTYIEDKINDLRDDVNDSDECNTVIEHDCDNDYSFICDSLNRVYS